MDISCQRLRDRRVAASDETISVAGGGIYFRRSHAWRRGSVGAYDHRGVPRFDREPDSIRAIILHQTEGRDFLSGVGERGSYPGREPDVSDGSSRRPMDTSESIDRDRMSNHAIDRIASHFVIINDGTIFYTHDIQFLINSAGGRRGIDIEFAGNYSRSYRLSPAAIISGRRLIVTLKRRIPSIGYIHPHGQVQKMELGPWIASDGDRRRRGPPVACGGSTGNECDKFDICPGPDVWINVGEWATHPSTLNLIAETPISYYQNNGISRRQRDSSFDQHIFSDGIINPWSGHIEVLSHDL